MLRHIRFRWRGIFVFLARAYIIYITRARTLYIIRARERITEILVHRTVVRSFFRLMLNLRLLCKSPRSVKIDSITWFALFLIAFPHPYFRSQIILAFHSVIFIVRACDVEVENPSTCFSKVTMPLSPRVCDLLKKMAAGLRLYTKQAGFPKLK